MTHRNRSRSSSLEPHRGVRSSRALVTGRLLPDDDQRFSTTLGADDPLRSHFRHTLAPLRDPIRSSPSWIIDDARAPTMPPVIVFLFLFFFFRPTVLYRGASIVREPVEGVGSCDLEKGGGVATKLRVWKHLDKTEGTSVRLVA